MLKSNAMLINQDGIRACNPNMLKSNAMIINQDGIRAESNLDHSFKQTDCIMG